jgi:hypothetical protein
MGLELRVFDFGQEAPPLRQLVSAVVELSDQEIDVRGTFEPPADELEERARRTESRRSLPLSRASVTLKFTRGRRRLYLDLTRSLHGTKICVCGNDLRLLKLAALAMENLGGTEETRKSKAS